MTGTVSKRLIVAVVLTMALGSIGAANSEPAASEPAAKPSDAKALAARGPENSGNPVSDIPFGSLSAMRERPLFSPSRRPSSPPTAPGEEKAARWRREAEPPPLTLLGTVTGAEARLALFLDERSQSIVRRRLGEAESGWVVKSIEAKTVTFERDSHEFVVTLHHEEAAAEPPKPSPPRTASATAVGRDKKPKRH